MYKKVFIIFLLSLVLLTGCNKDVKEEKVKKESLTINEEKSETNKLYVNVIPKYDQENTNKISNEIKIENPILLNVEEDNSYNEEITEVNQGIENIEEINNDDIETINEVVEESITSEDDNGKDDKSDEVLDNKEVLEEEKEDNSDKTLDNNDEETEEIVSETAIEESTTYVNTINDIYYLKNGFYEENNNMYYYENDAKVTGLKNINGINNYFSPSGKYLGTTKVKVIDVSYYQGDINWDLFYNESDCYGVILRLGYYTFLDKKFERNISELKRLNIPYGIYLFSYATTLTGSKKESTFTSNMIKKYDLNPTLGIYYDIESWTSKTSSSNNITKDMYDVIIENYINSVSYNTNYKYKVKVYSGRWYAMNRLGPISKKYVDWVAEYNSTCKYDSSYSMWQYTSKGNVPGINGNVDISYLY